MKRDAPGLKAWDCITAFTTADAWQQSVLGAQACAFFDRILIIVGMRQVESILGMTNTPLIVSVATMNNQPPTKLCVAQVAHNKPCVSKTLGCHCCTGTTNSSIIMLICMSLTRHATNLRLDVRSMLYMTSRGLY